MAMALWLVAVAAWNVLAPLHRPAQVGGSTAPPPPVLLERLPEGQLLVGRLGFLIDAGGTLSVGDLLAPAMAQQFHYPAEPQHLGLGRDIVWVRMDFEVPAGAVGADPQWLLSFPSVAARDVRFYGPYREGAEAALAKPIVTGGDHPYAGRPLAAERMVFPFQLPPPGRYTAFLRVHSDVPQIYMLRFWREGDYLVGTQDKRLFDGVSYGILIGMLVYNLLLLVIFRERVHAYYLLTCAFAVLAIASFNGHVMRYLLPGRPGLAMDLYLLAPLLWVACAAQFGRHFLNLRRYAPVLDFCLAGLAAALGLSAMAVLADSSALTHWAQRATEVGTTLGGAVMVLGATRAWRGNYRPALLYLAGLGILVAAALLLVLSNWGVLPWKSMWLNLLQAGVAAELVVFSVALGSRIRLLQRSQRELHARADWLATQVETDPLTGAVNRAGLMRRGSQHIATGAPLALMLLDLDGFKPVNDRFGHDAGDKVLVEVVRRLRAQMRETDTVARYGGDEFVLLLPGDVDRQVLAMMAHRVVEQVRAPVEYEGQSLVVTASIGIARFPVNARDLPGLLRAADLAMYHSKQQRQLDFAFPEDLRS